MRTCLTIVLCLVLASIGKAQVTKQSDPEIAKALLGTWEGLANRSSNKVVGESTYAQDGTVTGYTTPTAQAPGTNAPPAKIKMQARWKVDQGILVVDSYETEPTGVLPQGYSARYEILSLTGDEVVFRVLGSQQELYRRRKKD